LKPRPFKLTIAFSTIVDYSMHAWHPTLMSNSFKIVLPACNTG
jgi:hypothetical protein